MNQRKYESPSNPGSFRKLFFPKNKKRRKLVFFVAVVLISSFIWLLGWLIELIVSGLFYLFEWAIAAI